MAALLHIPCAHLHPTAAAASARPRLSISRSLPARDRIIDFGKHKGRMLGSLPSSYLQWVSKNLRARESEEWARLADEVLQDPVYRDRLEWEAAERILTGDGHARRRSSSGVAESPVADLISVSERFGWDNEDKGAWSRINFELLGTSKGGRIPRTKNLSAGGKEGKDEIFHRDSKLRGGVLKKSVEVCGKSIDPANDYAGSSASAQRPNGGRKDSIFDGDSEWRTKQVRKSIVSSVASTKRNNGASAVVYLTPRELQRDSILRADSEGHRYVIREEQEEEEEEEKMKAAGKGGESREERRERRRLKREQQLQMLRREMGLEEGSGRDKEGGGFVQRGALGTERLANPFPGRSSLLEKLRRRNHQN